MRFKRNDLFLYAHAFAGCVEQLMKTFALKFLPLFIIALCASLPAANSFAEFEMNSFGSARAIGEGCAYTAVTDNINSIFYNPAAAEFNSDQNYLIGYKQGISGATGYALGFTKKLTESDLIGFGMDNTDSSGASNGLMALSYARKLNDQFTLGLSAKRLYLSSSSFSGDSLSGNLGLTFHMNKNVDVGLIYNNLVKTNFKTGVNSEEVVLGSIGLGISLLQDGPLVERVDFSFSYSQDEHYTGLGFDAGLVIRIFNFRIWKGYSYLREEVDPESYYDNYLHSSRTGPWEEAIGIGIPISNDLIVEWSNRTDNLNIFSLLYKI